jgi:hypothetical protein
MSNDAGDVVYYYKDKPYKIVSEIKFKASGILEIFGVVDVVVGDNEWVDIVIYETLYNNPDGKTWARTKKQFYELFKTK